MPDKKETAQGRFRALAFVKGETLAKEKDVQISEDEIQTWPYLVRKEFLAAIIITIILMVWSIMLDAPLEEPSDPTLTPNPAKAPWYFLGLQEMLV
ncbi:MAG: cytochrome C, partial [Thermodesulfobacteriota bacterium]